MKSNSILIVRHKEMKNKAVILVGTVCSVMLCGSATAGCMPAPPFHKPVIIGTRLFSVAEPEGEVVCVDLRNRQVAWRSRLGMGYYGLCNVRSNLIANSGDEFTVISCKEGRVVSKGKLPGMLMGVGEAGSVLIVRDSDHSLAGFASEEERTIWTVPKVRVDPVAVSKHFLFCISEHEVTFRMNQKLVEADVTKGEYAFLCIDLKTGAQVWKKPLDYARHGDAGHDIPLKESSGLLLCTVANSVWLVDAQNGSLLATKSFPSEQIKIWGLSSVRVCDALFWGTSKVVVVTGRRRFPPNIAKNSYSAYILDLPSLEIQKRISTPPLLYESIVIGDVLYSGATAIHLPESRIISRGQNHKDDVRWFGGWIIPSGDGWLYMAGCRGKSAKYGTSRVLARQRLGTDEFEELLEEPSSFAHNKEHTVQAESTVPPKAAASAPSDIR